MKPTRNEADALDASIDALLDREEPGKGTGAQAGAAISPDIAHVVQDLHDMAEATPMRETFMRELEARLLQDAEAPSAGSISTSTVVPHSPAGGGASSKQATSAGWRQRVARSWRAIAGPNQPIHANSTMTTSSPQTSGARSRRLFSPALVIVGVALMVAFFIGISALLQARKDVMPVADAGTSTATMVALPGTPIVSTQSNLDFVSALGPRLTIDANLLDKDNRGNTTIAWNPDGSTIATASLGNNITMWDAATGKLARTIETGHKERLAGLAWSPDGAILASRFIDEATWRGLVVLWDAASGKELRSFPEENGLVTGMAWSPDGRTLAWTDGWSIRLWDATSSTLLPKPQPTWPAPIIGSYIGPNMVTNLAWSPHGNSLATSQGQVIKLWDPVNGKELMTLETPELAGSVLAMAWSSDGYMVAALVVSQTGGYFDTWLKIWDITTGRAQKTPAVYVSAAHIAWSPNRNLFAYSNVSNGVGGPPNALIFHDPLTNEALRTIDTLATDLAWSPDGGTLAIANGSEGTITLWGVMARSVPKVTAEATSPTARGTITPRPTSGPPGTLGCGWSSVTVPSTGSVDSGLSAIAAVSATDIWAVGSFLGTDQLQRNLIEHWDGTQWSIVPGPSRDGPNLYEYLIDLAAVASDDIWAVGGYGVGQKDPLHEVIMHWDGQSWTHMPVPSPGENNSLLEVAAASKNDVWAVGWFSEVADQGVYLNQPLIEHWDGKLWSVVQTPDVGTGGLSGIAIVSPSDIWAVGGGGNGALIMHWDGITWKEVSPPIGAGGLNKAVALAVDDVWAVGEGEVLHWDGSQWSIVPPITNPTNPNGISSFLNSVTATSQSDIWAVGQLVARWSSKDNWMDRGWWDTQVNPNVGEQNARDARISLSDIAAISPNNVWVVGYRYDANMQQLIMHYDGSLCAKPTGLPTATPAPITTSIANSTPTGDYPQYKEPASARFEIRGSMGIRGGKNLYKFDGKGDLSGGQVQEEITQDLPSGQTPSGGPGVRILNVVLADTKGYAKVSGDYIGADDRWYAMDLNEGWGGRHTLPGLMGNNLTGPNPAYEAAIQSTQIGKEVINGITTTKYRLDVDLQELYSLRGMPSEWPGGEAAAQSKMTLYVWIGDSDMYIHQEQLMLETNVFHTSDSSPDTKVPLGTLELTTTITYRDFDAPVTITIPSDTTPFDLGAGSPPNSWYPGEPSSAGLMPGFPISLALIPINPFLAEEVPASP